MNYDLYSTFNASITPNLSYLKVKTQWNIKRFGIFTNNLFNWTCTFTNTSTVRLYRYWKNN